MKLNKDLTHVIAKTLTIFYLFGHATFAYSCEQAQIIDYDYQVKETLGSRYSTFGRLWTLDNEKSCTEALKHNACLSIKPEGSFAEVTIQIHKNSGTSSKYTQKVRYNSSEVIRFNAMAMDVYLKLFVSNTISDLKMSGKSCEDGFPNMPRQVTRDELNNMFKK